MLALAFCLRAWMAVHGGQFFWPEESRFESVLESTHALLEQRFEAAGALMFGDSEHIGFKLISLVPAFAKVVFDAPIWVSSLFFASISTWLLWLIGCVARAAGASDSECLLAIVFAACSTALFYHSRHFLPYDLALALLLLGLLASLRGERPRHWLAAGVWLGVGYLTFYDYWPLACCFFVAHALLGLPDTRDVLLRATYAALGTAIPIAVATCLSRAFGHDFLTQLTAHTASGVGADVGDAWILIPAYFWAAERLMLLFWAIMLLAAFERFASPQSPKEIIWPGLTVLLVSTLILFSDATEISKATAIHVRALTPFFCLTSAAVICREPQFQTRPKLVAALIVLVFVQGAANLARPLTQVFPGEFESLADRFLARARKTDVGPYEVVNARFLHNPGWVQSPPVSGEVVLKRLHPFQFKPYLYDAHTPTARSAFERRDPSMRVIRLAAGGAPAVLGSSAILELALQFPTKPLSLSPEPLISTGVRDRGDLVYLRYDDVDSMIIGHDHLGGSGSVSARLPLDRGTTHKVVIGIDSPTEGAAATAKSRLFVIWNDAVVLHNQSGIHPTAPDQIAIGQNTIGSTTATFQLSAKIAGFQQRAMPPTGNVFSKRPGAMNLEIILPSSQKQDFIEPLLSSGPPGGGDLLYLRGGREGTLQIGHDSWGGESWLSDRFEVDPGKPLKLVVAAGPFMEETTDESADESRKRRLFVRANEFIVVNRVTSFNPSTVDQLSLGKNFTASTVASDSDATTLIRSKPADQSSIVYEPGGFPGAIRFKLRFFKPPMPGSSEPILSTGSSGAGDLLFIRFDDAGNFRIGHDHWGVGSVLSEPRRFDPNLPLELTIASGSLLPSTDDSTHGDYRQWSDFAGRLVVAVGRDVILNQPAKFHPAAPSTRTIGYNLIGASTASKTLSADLLEIAPVWSDEIDALLVSSP